MIIDDKYLIEHVLNYKNQLFLHKDTIGILNKIKSLMEQSTNITFRNKEVSIEIKNAWVCILQDSIHNLKCCDFREYAHWNRKKDCRNIDRDINNDYAFGLDTLRKYFEKFTEFERVLYGVDGNYRDHVIHVFRVWLLGLSLILSSEPGIDMNIKDIEFEKLIPDKSILIDEEIISIWAIIALCHDLGYPLEKAEKINESVEKMYRHIGKMNIQRFSAAFQQEHQFLNKFILDFISSKIEVDKDDEDSEKGLNKVRDNFDGFFNSSELPTEDYKKIFIDDKYYRTVVQAKYYIKFAKSLEIYSHGIISCSILFKALFYFLESDYNPQEKPRLSFEDARQFCIRKEILRSIASHTCPEVYHLKPNTFAFLLILCDELQEWGRPRFDELQSDSENKDKEKQIAIKKFGNKEIEFSIKYIKSIADNDLPNALAKSMFSRWHAILRSAVFDTYRKFTMMISLEINDQTYIFLFKDNCLTVTCNEKPSL